MLLFDLNDRPTTLDGFPSKVLHEAHHPFVQACFASKAPRLLLVTDCHARPEGLVFFVHDLRDPRLWRWPVVHSPMSPDRLAVRLANRALQRDAMDLSAQDGALVHTAVTACVKMEAMG